MLDFLSMLNSIVANEPIFWFFALAGSGVFIIQFLMNFVGIDDESSQLDSGNFKWLSKQALAGFLMMFGLVGLTCRKEFGYSYLTSTTIAFGAGLVAIIATSYLFKAAKKLHSSGTVFNIDEAIGKEATIYQRIPKGGVGKITVSLHHFTHEIDAISFNQEDLLSFTRVQIIKKADERTVVVIPSK